MDFCSGALELLSDIAEGALPPNFSLLVCVCACVSTMIANHASTERPAMIMRVIIEKMPLTVEASSIARSVNALSGSDDHCLTFPHDREDVTPP